MEKPFCLFLNSRERGAQMALASQILLPLFRGDFCLSPKWAVQGSNLRP